MTWIRSDCSDRENTLLVVCFRDQWFKRKSCFSWTFLSCLLSFNHPWDHLLTFYPFLQPIRYVFSPATSFHSLSSLLPFHSFYFELPSLFIVYISSLFIYSSFTSLHIPSVFSFPSFSLSNNLPLFYSTFQHSSIAPFFF